MIVAGTLTNKMAPALRKVLSIVDSYLKNANYHSFEISIINNSMLNVNLFHFIKRIAFQ